MSFLCSHFSRSRLAIYQFNMLLLCFHWETMQYINMICYFSFQETTYITREWGDPYINNIICYRSFVLNTHPIYNYNIICHCFVFNKPCNISYISIICCCFSLKKPTRNIGYQYNICWNYAIYQFNMLLLNYAIYQYNMLLLRSFKKSRNI